MVRRAAFVPNDCRIRKEGSRPHLRMRQSDIAPCPLVVFDRRCWSCRGLVRSRPHFKVRQSAFAHHPGQTTPAQHLQPDISHLALNGRLQPLCP